MLHGKDKNKIINMNYPQKEVKIESSNEFEKILSNYVLIETPYFGSPESKYNYVHQNFNDGQASLELSPPTDSTLIEPENNNIYLITKDIIYSMGGVSEQQYDEWYQDHKEYDDDFNNENHQNLKYIKLFEEYISSLKKQK